MEQRFFRNNSGEKLFIQEIGRRVSHEQDCPCMFSELEVRSSRFLQGLIQNNKLEEITEDQYHSAMAERENRIAKAKEMDSERRRRQGMQSVLIDDEEESILIEGENNHDSPLIDEDQQREKVDFVTYGESKETKAANSSDEKKNL